MQTLPTSQFLQQHKHLQPMLVLLNKQAVSFTNALAGKTPFSWQKDLLVVDIDHAQHPIAINPLEASLYRLRCTKYYLCYTSKQKGLLISRN